MDKKISAKSKFLFFHQSVVPDKKSPPSDIFILAPFAYKSTRLYFNKKMKRIALMVISLATYKPD